MRLRLRTDRLAAILAASRLSQNHWALRLGLSRGHWSDIVNGRHPFPSAKTRERMLEVFGVGEADLFEREAALDGELEIRVALAPRYEIVRELGQGAMGTVFLATDRDLGRLVAIKVVNPEAAAGVGSRALLTEIAIVARLQHPNILSLFEAGEVAGHPFYVMPFVRDGSLRALLDQRRPLGLGETVRIADGIARGLTHAHAQQVLHCDVKPENVLVQEGHAFVTDFGIARKLRSEADEWRGIRRDLDLSAGTPAYVSPEQASGTEPIDERSDVYSLACVVFEMLSGTTPFGGRTTQEIVSRRFHEPPPLATLGDRVPPAIVDVLGRALAVAPTQRPPTPAAFAEALREATGADVGTATYARRSVASSRPGRQAIGLGGRKPRPRPRVQRGERRHQTQRARMPMTGLGADLRFVVRALTRGWRFTSGVVLTLALGIGLGAPVLSLADQFFLRPPPGVADADRVVRLVLRGFGSNGPYTTDGLTGLDYATISRARSLSGVAGWIDHNRSLGRGSEARSIPVTLASAAYFSVLGVRPFLGRFYQASEDVEGAGDAPCVVSYRFWQTTLDGRTDALGRRLRIGDVQYTVVGVAPEGFNGLGLRAVDAWLPLRVATPEQQGNDPELWTTDHSSWLRLVARLAPGVSLAQAAAEAGVLYRTAGERTRDRELRGTYTWDPLQPGRSSSGSTSARISLWLGGGAALLLVLIAANLVNLFVARSAAHTRQTAVRLAIGGNWRHLLRLQLLEAAVLGVAAAIVGLAITAPAVRVARALLLPGMVWARPALDPRVALLAFAIAFGVGAVVAAWTTAQALRADPLSLLRGAGSPAMSGSRRSQAVRRTLLVVQAAVFAVLLTGASAFVVSLRRASTVSFGFDIESVMSARIPLPADVSRPAARELMERARDRVATLPEVESASLGYMEPWQNNTSIPFSVPGSTVTPPYTMVDMVTPEYLQTFGVRMREGRWFSAADGPDAEPVVILNEALAHIYWPAGGAVGRCMRVGADSMPCRIIIGVVRDFRVTGGADDAPRPVYYLPHAQTAGFRQLPTLFVRPRGEAATTARSVRQALQGLEPNLQAVSVHLVSDNVAWLTAPLRLGAAAFTAFGIVAAIVAAVGLYSVLAFMIVEGSRAYAIRLAIGAAPVYLARSVVRFALITVGAGVLAGALVLVPLARVLEPLLFHTAVLDPRALLAVALLGLLTTLLATVAPVRAVVRTDVMRVLREQ